MRIALLAATAVLAGLSAVSAQQGERRDRPTRDPYVTSSGETVDKPGVPQGSGTTRMDRDIQRRDNQIDNSLCKGC